MTDLTDKLRDQSLDRYAPKDLLCEAATAIEEMIEGLEEISLGMGEFNRDRLTHAENAIEHMKKTAREVLAKRRGPA